MWVELGRGQEVGGIAEETEAGPQGPTAAEARLETSFQGASSGPLPLLYFSHGLEFPFLAHVLFDAAPFSQATCP